MQDWQIENQLRRYILPPTVLECGAAALLKINESNFDLKLLAVFISYNFIIGIINNSANFPANKLLAPIYLISCIPTKNVLLKVLKGKKGFLIQI